MTWPYHSNIWLFPFLLDNKVSKSHPYPWSTPHAHITHSDHPESWQSWCAFKIGCPRIQPTLDAHNKDLALWSLQKKRCAACVSQAQCQSCQWFPAWDECHLSQSKNSKTSEATPLHKWQFTDWNNEGLMAIVKAPTDQSPGAGWISLYRGTLL